MMGLYKMNLKSADAVIKQYIMKDLSKYGIVDISFETTNLIRYFSVNHLQAVYKDVDRYRSRDGLINYRVKAVINDNNDTLFYAAEVFSYIDNYKNYANRYLLLFGGMPTQSVMLEIISYLMQLESLGKFPKTFICIGCGRTIGWLDISGSLVDKMNYAQSHYCGC